MGPPASVQSMVVWLTKRRGGDKSQAKEDDATDGVTSFAQMDRIVCRHCQETGHFNWDCPKASARQRQSYRELSRNRQAKFSDDLSVGSDRSSDSGRSNDSSNGSGNSSNGSASGGNVRSNGRRPSTPRRKPQRRGVFEMSNFAFGTEGMRSAFG